MMTFGTMPRFVAAKAMPHARAEGRAEVIWKGNFEVPLLRIEVEYTVYT